MHSLEPQRSGVQVIEWVGLITGIEHIFTRRAVVFAEECGGFGMFATDGPIKRCVATLILRIHIRASSQVSFNGFNYSVSTSSIDRFFGLSLA